MVLVVGCRDSGGGSVADARTDSAQGQTKVSDVQNDAMAVGTPVTLKGVVVTAIDKFGEKKGNFYVADPAGGPFSGVLVFGAPLEVVDTLAIGDIVTIEGAQKDEFALMDDMSGRKTTELKPVTGGVIMVTKTGTGTAPAPAMVDAAALAAMPEDARFAELEKWEGVLITIKNVTALTAPRQVSMGDATFQDFTVTSGVRVDSSLAAFPAMIKRDDCLASVTGMGDYFFNYKVLPRTTDEVVTGGTACPAKEAGPTACHDQMDNDLDGFKDCDDLSCSTDPTSNCAAASTVVNVQNGTVTANSFVNLQNVIVTGRDEVGTSKGLWVADAGTAAQHNGVYVFLGGTALDAAWTIGATVNVLGKVVEFDVGNPAAGNTLTEITTATVSTVAAAAQTVTALASTAGVAGDITAGEPFEGVLTTIPTLKVTAVNGTGATQKVDLVDNAGKTVVMAKEAFDFTAPAVGACLTLTGPMSLDLGADKRTINPRAASDIATTTGCN